MRYSDDLIQEICSRNDIVEYISRYVQLKRSGRDYSGLCPFHNEKSPSFHVSADKQLFHCFGCGAGGSLIQFVMRMENLDFVESLKLLADRAGITLPENSNTIDDKLHEARTRIRAMNKIAARFYYDMLTKEAEGEEARQYFAERKISPKTIIAYGLGYAPDHFDALLSNLRLKGYTDEQIVEAGLAAERSGRIYDRFRGRVMFPIIDLRGNVIGFGGRIMNNAQERDGYKPPKYLNSAETPAFNKGNNLFSLNLAKKSNSDKLILVEGYMDVITVYQAGIPNIVATLGTALTESQAKLMKKYCSEILICYDSDEAGQKAAMRAIDIINSVGGKSRVIKLKGAKDPDEYIKKNGAAMFRQAVEAAVPSTEFKISVVKINYDLNDTEDKVRFVSEAADALVGITDAVEVDAYIRKVAEQTQISKDAIYSEYKKKSQRAVKMRTPQQNIPPSVNVVRSKGAPAAAPQSGGTQRAEKMILNLCVRNKRACAIAQKELPSDDYSTELHRRLAKMIYESRSVGEEPNPAVMLSYLNGGEQSEASAVFYNMEVYEDEERAAADAIRKIKLDRLDERLRHEDDPIKMNELIRLQTELRRKK
jgi:DNA primase